MTGELSILKTGNPTVEDLEAIAIKSQEAVEPIYAGVIYRLGLYEQDSRDGGLGIKFGSIVKDIKEIFLGETLIVCNLNCHAGEAVADMNEVGCIEAFGTGGMFMYSRKSRLPRNRYIITNSNSLSIVPDKSFHLLISYHGLECDNVVGNVFPQIFRVLKDGGLAIFDWEAMGQVDQVLSLPREIVDATSLVGVVIQDRHPVRKYIELGDYFNEIIATKGSKVGKLPQDEQTKMGTAMTNYFSQNYRFEIQKPFQR